MSRIGRLTVAALAAVLVIAGLAVYFFVPRFLGDRRPEAAYVPLFAEIEPADDAVIRGTEAWIRWTSSMPAKGRVLWRKAGDSEFQTVEAGDGVHLRARLRPLQPDGKYEYAVQQSADGMTQHSGLRTFTVRAGVVFDPSTVEQSVQRDYDQTVTLTLRNDAKEKMTVAAEALAKFEDLPADIVGPGSVDEPAEIEPGQKLNLRFAIAAADAARQTYDIPIEAAGASALVRLRVGQPKLNLSFRVVGENPHTLATTIEVRNEGDTVADLAIRAAQPNDAEVRLEPRANHTRLGRSETLRFIASPILYLEFQSLKVELEATAAGQTVRFPVEFTGPPGQRLIGVRTGSHKETSCNDWYCTNRPTTCSTCPGPAGNGPAMPPAAEGRGPTRVVEGLNERRSGQTRPLPEPTRTLLSLDSVSHAERFLRASAPGVAQLVDSGKADGGGPCGDATVCDDDETTVGDQSYSAACDQVMCEFEDVRSCYDRARELQARYRKLSARWFAEASQRHHPPGNMDEIVAWHEAQLNRRRLSGLPDWILDAAYVEGLKDIQREVRDVRASYDALKEKCYAKCRIVLPVLFGDMPQVSSYDMEIQWLRTLSPAERERYLDKAGLPRNFLVLCKRDQQRKQVASVQRTAYEHRQELAELCGKVLTPVSGGELAIKNWPGKPITALDIYCWFYSLSDEGLAEFYKAEACDPPRKDFEKIEEPSVTSLPLPAPTTETERLGWEAVTANRWKVAYLRAWLTSYERYLGAQAARNREAMVRQATAMVNFGSHALQASRTAAEKWYDFQQSALASLKERLNALSGAGIGWAEIIDTYRQNHAGTGIPAKLRETLTAGGMSPAETDTIRKRLSSLTKEQAEVRYEVWRRRLETAAAQREMAQARPRAVRPEPPDHTALSDRLHFSRELLERAKVGSAEERWPLAGKSRVQPRPGLQEALQRRAAFSRAHRGPFAVPRAGDAPDSGVAPASWHAGDRVAFSWHQRENEIVFATVDPRGDVLRALEIIGKGRWPRLAAEGKRTAVAWSHEDSFVVRLHDGSQWGAEIGLSGREAALAFAPGGPLYAATSTGLWRLGDKGFEQINQARYSQPAVAIDGQGRPQVASERNGRVLYGDAEVDEGQRPSLTITSDGTPHLAYLSKGAVVVRSRRGDQWSAPETIPARNPSWPTLATDGTGVRLTYLGAADHGPEALWLVRLPDKQPILMPSLTGNVTDAWLVVNFGLNALRSKYRPHDVLLTVNDVWIKMFENTVPDGRYLFRLNPYHIFTSAGRPAPNRIGIRSWHMNSGHYMSSSDYRLIVRTAWSERYAFAASEDEVRRVADNPHPTHDQPDLVVLANELELPVAAPKPGRINLTVTIGNLGEVESQPARLEMLSGQRSLASARVPPLKPGELTNVKMPLDYDGRLERVTFKIHQDKPDLNPKNDTLTLTLWGAPPSPTAREPISTEGTGEQPPSPKFDSGIKLEVASWVPKRDSQQGWWGVTHKGAPPDKRLHWTKTADTLLMPPGNYDLYWKQTYDPAPVLLANDIKINAGQVMTFKVDTGIRLELAPWVPRRDSQQGWWGVTRQGEPPDKRVHWTKTADPLVLPPGSYDLYWKQAYDPAPVALVSAVKVEPGQVITFKADTGIRLEVASWVPKRDSQQGWWGATRQGEPPDKRVHWTKTADALVLPPGSYDVYWKQAYDPAPVLLASAVKVETGQLQTVGANSGIKLRMAAGTPALDPSHGWWGVVRTGEGPDKRLHWAKGRFDQPLLVPPGRYDVFWKQNYAHKPERVKEDVTVESNRLVEIDVTPPRQAGTR